MGESLKGGPGWTRAVFDIVNGYLSQYPFGIFGESHV